MVKDKDKPRTFRRVRFDAIPFSSLTTTQTAKATRPETEVRPTTRNKKLVENFKISKI